MKVEERLEFWGWVVFWFGITGASLLVWYAGEAPKKYSSYHWGESGVLWSYMIAAVAAFLHAIIIKQILNGIAESIRLKREDLNLPSISCPACDEPIREAAKVCRYCRCVLKKPESSKQPT